MKSLKVNLNKYVNHSLFKNLSIVFLESIITKALSFISILILSRQLYPEDYGKYSFVFVTVAFVVHSLILVWKIQQYDFQQEIKGKCKVYLVYIFYKNNYYCNCNYRINLIWQSYFSSQGKDEIIQYIPYLIVGYIGNHFYLLMILIYKLFKNSN